ncbi:MAG: hypothetical protein M1837_005707 [Sclerophora amabilis]|nr:MAG: hypothetical protein M1837_005707 [Sclerophora amabilis]
MQSSPSPATSPSPKASPRIGTAQTAGATAPDTTATTSYLQPRLAFAASEGQQDVRRPSVQFATRTSESRLPTGDLKPPGRKVVRRMSSPPPPALFQNRVSFDTFDNRDATDFTLTLNSKHKDYQYTRRSRTFLCGTDQNDYSEFALEWLIDELLDDGDEVVCLRVVDKDSKINSDTSVEEGKYRTEAKKLLDQIIEKNTEDKAISLVLEFAVGKVHDTIQRMIHIYEPAILIVGTRGRSLGGIQGLLPGSVSKYCLQHSPVPVIVVRPTFKREKKKKKRQQNPARKGYLNILERSGAKGTHSHMLDKSNRNSIVANAPQATDEEAEAVAAAIGLLPPNDDEVADMPPISKVHSTKSDATSATSATSVDSMSPRDEELYEDDPKSPGIVMKSPELRDLDSPALSESEASDDEDDDRGKFEAVPGSMAGLKDPADPDTEEEDEGEADTAMLQRSPELRDKPDAEGGVTSSEAKE